MKILQKIRQKLGIGFIEELIEERKTLDVKETEEVKFLLFDRLHYKAIFRTEVIGTHYDSWYYDIKNDEYTEMKEKDANVTKKHRLIGEYKLEKAIIGDDEVNSSLLNDTLILDDEKIFKIDLEDIRDLYIVINAIKNIEEGKDTVKYMAKKRIADNIKYN